MWQRLMAAGFVPLQSESIEGVTWVFQAIQISPSNRKVMTHCRPLSVSPTIWNPNL